MDKSNISEEYKNNPVKFCEDILGLRLNKYQKQILNIFNNNKKSYICQARNNSRTFILNTQIEFVKAMLENFCMISHDEIKIYEKGILTKTIKQNKEEV